MAVQPFGADTATGQMPDVVEARIASITGSGGVVDPLTVFRSSLTPAQTQGLESVRAALAGAEAVPVSIVTAGDSLTFGANATAGLGWVERLATYLAATFQTKPYSRHAVVNPSATSGPPSSAGAHVYNAGFGGAKAQDYLSSGTIPKIAALKPRLVIHAPGFNDWRHGITPAGFRTDVQNRLNQLQAATTAPVTHLLIHWFEHSDAHGPAAWHEYGTALETLASEYDNVVYADLSGPFYALGVPGADPLNLLDADMLHPTNAGHDLMARMVFELLTYRAPEPTGPAVYAADTYSGADGALTVTEIGGKTYATFGNAGGAWSRAGGRLVANKLAVATAPAVIANTGHADGVVSLTLISATNDGLMFRQSDSVNYWLLGINAGVYKLFKNEAGTLGAVATSTVVPAANDVVTVTLNGSAIAVAINGTDVPALSVTDAFNASASSHGAWAGGAVARTALFDDFEHRSLA